MNKSSKPKKKGKGRNSRLTAEVEQVIVEAIKAGNYLSNAAEFAGVAAATIREWIRRGEDRDPKRPSTLRFAEFAAAVRKAEAENKVITLARIQRAAEGGIETKIVTRTLLNGVIETAVIERTIPGDWRAAAWFLERRYPNEWGRRTRMKHSSPGSGQVEHNVVFSEEIEALLAKVYGRSPDDQAEAK